MFDEVPDRKEMIDRSLKLRTKLIGMAIDLNENYRTQDDDKSLDIGFLYGTVEMIVALTLLVISNESYSEVREEIAKQINEAIYERDLRRKGMS